MYSKELFNTTAQQLCDVGRFLFGRGWSPATSSNYSARLNEQHIAITSSGKSKGELTIADIMVVDLQGIAIAEHSHQKPSAETLLHTLLYQREGHIGSVLHTHSVNATVLSRLYAKQGYIQLEDYELLKALRGITTHETQQALPIFPNTQDMGVLSAQVAAYLDQNTTIHGYLIEGHGLYTWGDSIAEARRHIEACEFLFDCEVLTLQLRR